MKKSNSYLKLFGLLVLGGVTGMLLGMVSFWGYDGFVDLAKGMEDFFRKNGVGVELAVVFVCVAAVTGIYLYVRKLWKKEETAEDEQADRYGEKFEFWSQLGLVIAEVAAGMLVVLGFVFPPVQLSDSGQAVTVLIVTGIMIGGTVYMAIFSIMYYHLIQRRDPKKKGDPSSFSFNKKWLASCDETEKLVIYRAAYKGFTTIQVMLLAGIVLAGVGKIRFHTGNFPIILLGIIWIAGNLSFGIWKLKGLSD